VTAPPVVTAPPRTTTVNPSTGPDVIVTAADTADIGKLLEKREQLDRAMKEKFQRVLTVMFTDLKGSTALAEASGDSPTRSPPAAPRPRSSSAWRS
jgi:class 3 adenylate cyclase